MARNTKSIAVDATLVLQAEQAAADVRRAAESEIRETLQPSAESDRQAWIERNRAAFRSNAERDRKEGLANESLRQF